MASIFKQKYTKVDPKTGERVTRKSKKWYGQITHADGRVQRVALSADKTVAGQMLNQMIRRIELGKVGIHDPFEEHAKRPLTEHIAKFEELLKGRDRSTDYTGPVLARVRRIVEACEFKRIGDISSSAVETYLGTLRDNGTGQRTINHYLAAIKQFTRWLMMDRRTAENRLAFLQAGNAQADVRRRRREFESEELQHLLAAALTGNDSWKMDGVSRYRLYSVAVMTGLRAKELSSLTSRSFDLDIEVPTVTIAAENEKAGRGDTLPIPAELAELLRPWLSTLTSDQPLWPGPWAKKKRGSKFIQYDLRIARAAWLNEAKNDKERKVREKLDFLKYRNADGEQADFHALRHTYLSRLGRSGASPKAMQLLARHTTVELTIGKYTHASLHDLAGAVEKLPMLLPVEQKNCRRTGS